MKSHLSILFILSILVSGCYTQLEYSQRVHKITDERPATKGYSWDGEDTANGADSEYLKGYEDGYAESYYYRDYAAADWYSRHGFGSYHDRYFGYSGWSHYDRFYDPFYHSYYPYRSFMSLRFHFGSPAFGFYSHYYPWSWNRHRYYWDPYYGYGHYNNFYNTYIFTGYGNNVGVNRDNENRRYGRRTIGTSRIDSGTRVDRPDNRGSTRSKSTVGRNSTTVRSRGTESGSGKGRSSGSSVRSRSNTGSEVRSTGRSGASGRSSGSGSSSGTRSRSDRSMINGIDNSGDHIDRSRNAQERQLQIARERIKNRLEQQRKSQPELRNRNAGNRTGTIGLNRFRNPGSSGSIQPKIDRSRGSSTAPSIRSRSSNRSSGRSTVSSSRSRSSSKSSSSSSSDSSSRSRSRSN